MLTRQTVAEEQLAHKASVAKRLRGDDECVKAKPSNHAQITTRIVTYKIINSKLTRQISKPMTSVYTIVENYNERNLNQIQPTQC